MKETKEVLKGVEVLATKIIARIGDGIGVDDAISLATDAELRVAVQNAVNGIALVDDELKAAGIDEYAELITAATPVVLAIIKAVRAAAAKKAA